MATYKQVGSGMSDDDDLKLQNRLASNGTGELDSNAQTASNEWSYKPFQASNETTAANNSRQEVSAQKPSDFSYGTYEKSDVVKQAEALLQQQLANKPGAYQSQWQTALDDTMNKILNREKFSYDLNGDALYQQYKDQYITQGQQAMMDTMGQAAAMTGGYGNSYAQTVGQQTYQGYLQQLNDRVPELYQLALDQYNREGDNLYNQYGLYADRENQDYGRYRDTVSDYYTEADRLTEDARYQGEQDYGKYMDQYNMSYGQYRDSVSDWQNEQARADENYWNLYNRDYNEYSNDRNLAYQQNRDQVSDSQWNQSFQYQQDRDKVSDDQWNQSFQYQQNRDQVSDAQWNQNFQYQQDRDKVSDEQWNQSFQYQQDRDQVSDSQWDQSFQYQQDRDKKSDEQWQAEFDEAKRQFDQQYAKSTGKSSSSSGGDGGNTGDDTGGDEPTKGGKGYDNGSVSEANIKALQAALGITADGKWGPKSKAAAGGLSADEAMKAYLNGTLEGADRLNEVYINKFMSSIHPESQHDAIARDQYGSYRQYVAQQIENADLSNAEKAYLISHYGITESDLEYKPKKNQTPNNKVASGSSSTTTTVW